MPSKDSSPSLPITRVSFPALIVASIVAVTFAAGGAWAMTHSAESNHETRLSKLESTQLPAAVEMQSVRDRLQAVERMQERQNLQLDRIELQTRK